MDYSNLTKEQIIKSIKSIKTYKINFRNLSEKLRDDKNIVLTAIKNNVLNLKYASERLQNDKELLEILEKEEFGIMEIQPHIDFISYVERNKWFNGRMRILELLREKELMESSIINSNIKSKKMKF